jgi:hypothetical protein
MLVLLCEDLVFIGGSEGLPARRGEEDFESIETRNEAKWFPRVVRGVVVRWRPFDIEEKALGLGRSAAVGVGCDFDVSYGINLIDVIAIDEITCIRYGLIRNFTVRKVGVRVVNPGKKTRDVEDRVNTGHGDWKSEAVGDGGDDGSDGEGT